MVTVETTVLVSGPLARVSLQLAREHQGSFILDLHQNLINLGVQQGEACEPSGGRLRAPIFPSISYPRYLLPPVLSWFLLSFSLLRLFFASQQCIFRVHVLSSPVKYIQHSLWVIFV